MRILIDTQVFIWLINEDERIGAKTYKLLNDSSNEISLSYFSLFEMKIKATIGKLEFDDTVIDDLPKMGIELITPSTEVLKRYSILNDANKDPFDNILIATARFERYAFITSDLKILSLSLQDLQLHDAQK
jgi:PIN domain nuclease of toxin-antitoxin system